MLGKFFKRFGKKPVLVPGTDKLAEGEARKVDIGDLLAGDGIQVLLCRIEGKVYAIDSLCPHEGGRMVPGPLQDGRLALCPLHNYKFDPTSGGKAVGVACSSARTYRVEESNGSCEIYL